MAPAPPRRRDHYALFSSGRIGGLALSNRLVRSATWDPSLLGSRQMNERVLDLYRELAAGGVGLIITGDIPVLPEQDRGVGRASDCPYEAVRIKGYKGLAKVVRRASPKCRIVAQISVDYPGAAPSAVASPFDATTPKPLSLSAIRRIVDCSASAIAGLRADGFDGVQLHAAHGGLLSRFLSPYSNRRQDDYGGSVHNRVRIVREIIAAARERVGDYPLLIKVNATDYVPGGIDLQTFPALAREIEASGVDAVEVSGGMWDCLVRTEEELGFRPVPSPESHTRIGRPARQSYFLPYAERLELSIPVILVGGNRHVERLEEIVRQGRADFIALCRPLICEPDLPKRWQQGLGAAVADCISCNSCLWDMWTHVEQGDAWWPTCLWKCDRGRVAEAQRWLADWVRVHGR